MLRGFDVSHWQFPMSTDIRQTLEDSRTDFIIAKMSEGATYNDTTCTVFLKNAIRGGKCVGVYHYINANTTAEDEVQNIIKNISAVKLECSRTLTNTSGCACECDFCAGCSKNVPKLLYALDWESKAVSADGLQKVKEMVRLLKEHFGKPPLLYCSASVLNSYRSSKTQITAWDYILTECGLWIAKWRKSVQDVGQTFDGMLSEPRFEHHGVCAIHQCASVFRTDGGKKISLDSDIAFMSREAWEKYAI